MRRPLALFVAACVAAGMAGSAEIPSSERRSSYEHLSAETKAMQDEDTANPGMLWVLDGEALWRAKSGQAGKACADCHGDARASMKGVAARYPAFDEKRGGPVDLAGRINLCRTDHQGARAFARESKDLLALAAHIGRQSRGLPVQSGDPRLNPFIDAGRAMFNARKGQLDLSCAQCHDDYWGARSSPASPCRRATRRASTLSAGVAESGLPAPAAAQLHDRHARRELPLRIAGIRGSIPDVARTRHEDRNAGRAAVKSQLAAPFRPLSTWWPAARATQAAQPLV